MAAIVADSSAIAAVLFEEPDSEPTASRLDRAERIVAPALLAFELANVCWKKIRRHPEQAAWFRERFRRLDALPVEFAEVNHLAVIDLAVETRLTPYDASYLWLARTLGAELLTLDTPLAAAARTPRS